MMLFLEIMAALTVGLLAWAVGLLYAVRREAGTGIRAPLVPSSEQAPAVRAKNKPPACFLNALTPSVSLAADSSLVRGSQRGAADGGEQTEAERAAEKKYTQGVLNVLNYSAEDARKGAAER